MVRPEKADHFIDAGYAAQLHSLGRRFRRPPVFALVAADRNDGLGKSQLRRLLQPRFRVRHRPDLSGQADLAKNNRVGRDRDTTNRRCQGRRHRQIGSRFLNPQTARDVQVHVSAGKRKPAPCFQNRQQHRQTA